MLFDAYLVIPCYHFKISTKQKHNGFLEGSLTMASGKAYVDWLKNKGQWGAKSPDNKKIMAVAAKINALKGQLTLDPKLSAIAKDKKKSSKGENKGKKFKNKNNSSNKKYQKKNEVWKKVPPKVNKKKTKEVGKFTFNWCEHHMVWAVNKPSDCTLGQKHKEDQKKDNNNKANSAVVASSATTLNNCYAALLATLPTMNKEE